MFITGTYNLVARPEWKNIQTETVYLECDTSLAPVVINLFPIVDLKRFWNVKINIIDKAQNCSVNNITINAGFSGTPPVQDIIDQTGNTQIVLTQDGESILITPVSENQWLANETIAVPSAVQSVTGLDTDNTDPTNPIVKISVDGTTITGQGTPLSPLESNIAVGTTQIISGTIGAVLFDNGTTVAESTNFVYDDGQIVLSLGGATSSAKGMLNLKAKDTLPTTYSIAVRKNDDSGYLFQVQNDGKLRINDNYTLPNSDGTAGQVLVTNGSGTVTFQSKQDPITLTTTGNSGASTLIGATLNIPEYTLAGLGGVPLGRSININGTTQDLSANRTFSVSDANLSMSDITTNNVSITQHGFVPKAPNDSTKFLDGTGNWQTVTISSLSGVPSSRTITINGTSQDLSANRTFSVSDANLSMSDITTNNVSTTQHGFAPKSPNDANKFLDGQGNYSYPFTAIPIQDVVSSATVTPTSANELVTITAQATGLTLGNPTGVWVQGQPLMIRIKDNGTPQSIGYDTNYRAIGVTLPTTTVANKTTYLGVIYNFTDTKWDIIGATTES